MPSHSLGLSCMAEQPAIHLPDFAAKRRNHRQNCKESRRSAECPCQPRALRSTEAGTRTKRTERAARTGATRAKLLRLFDHGRSIPGLVLSLTMLLIQRALTFMLCPLPRVTRFGASFPDLRLSSRYVLIVAGQLGRRYDLGLCAGFWMACAASRH